MSKRKNQDFSYSLLTVEIFNGFAPIFPDTCYHLTHHWPTAADIPVASDNPAHYADAIRYNARTDRKSTRLNSSHTLASRMPSSA